MLRPLLALGLTFSAAILACGGAVVPVGETSSSSGGTSSGGSTSSGGTSTSSGGTSTSSGGTSGVTPPGCAEVAKPGDRVCVPGLALSGVPISVDVDSQDSCLDCASTVGACDVSVNGNAITVTMQELSCKDSTSPGCACVLMEEQCVIPPLAAGTYDLTIGGGATSTGFHSQTLVVADGGPDTACILLPQGTSPPPIDPTKYSTACSADSDCVAVSTGDVCGPCNCANTVIATSDKARYDADFRATESQCAPSLPAGCPLCRGAAPHCLVSPDALVGTCVAGP